MFQIGDRVTTSWQGNIIRGRIIDAANRDYFKVLLTTGEQCWRYGMDLVKEAGRIEPFDVPNAPEKGIDMRDPYMGYEPYEAVPIVKEPLLKSVDEATIVAWFRCNSCYTCRFRTNVLDKDPNHDIKWCARTHEKMNIVDMVTYLGYSKE